MTTLIGAVLVALAAGPPGREIDPATVAAFEKLGAVYGGLVTSDAAATAFQPGAEAARRGRPGFRLAPTDDGE